MQTGGRTRSFLVGKLANEKKKKRKMFLESFVCTLLEIHVLAEWQDYKKKGVFLIVRV